MAFAVVNWRGLAYKARRSLGGQLVAERVDLVELAKLPRNTKVIRINLDGYCPGYDRDQIRLFKGTLLRLNGGHVAA